MPIRMHFAVRNRRARHCRKDTSVIGQVETTINEGPHWGEKGLALAAAARASPRRTQQAGRPQDINDARYLCPCCMSMCINGVGGGGGGGSTRSRCRGTSPHTPFSILSILYIKYYTHTHFLASHNPGTPPVRRAKDPLLHPPPPPPERHLTAAAANLAPHARAHQSGLADRPPEEDQPPPCGNQAR
jgi:hypothetical protein